MLATVPAEDVDEEEEGVLEEAEAAQPRVITEVGERELAEYKSSFRQHWVSRLSKATTMWELRQVSASHSYAKR
jgi:hypothetical protein